MCDHPDPAAAIRHVPYPWRDYPVVRSRHSGPTAICRVILPRQVCPSGHLHRTGRVKSASTSSG